MHAAHPPMLRSSLLNANELIVLAHALSAQVPTGPACAVTAHWGPALMLSNENLL